MKRKYDKDLESELRVLEELHYHSLTDNRYIAELRSELVKSGIEGLKSQVIKLGHHGSETSSGEGWLKLVDPDYAVIQSGEDNQFGHPSRRVIKRLQRLGSLSCFL